ncbi:MAG: hypothetical protein HYY25_10785 [Candidatus Wallbacteria bacterium]|nr:hypothetical protein [Candidatus Wallbacteria bacterium]
MDSGLEGCLQDFRSMDASVRLAALARMERLDDPRVTKALEALANDPNLHVAQRVREVLTARSGEAFRRGSAAPELGKMGQFDYWREAARLLARHPVPLIGTAVATMVVVPMLVATLLFAFRQDDAGWLVLASFVMMDSESEPAVSAGARTLYPLLEQPLGLLLMALTASLQAWVVSRIYLGAPVGLSSALAFGASRLAALAHTLAVYLLVSLAPAGIAVAIAIGLSPDGNTRVPDALFGALAVGGILAFAFLALRYNLATLCCATEGIRGWAACRRAGKLFGGSWRRVLVFSLSTLPLPIAYSLLTILGDINSDLAHLLFFVPYGALCGAAQVLLYYDVVARHPGSPPAAGR